MANDADKAWLSPTSASKLLACPAAVSRLPTGPRPTPSVSAPKNAGSLAHIAVQRWIENGGWRVASPSHSLVESYRAAAEQHRIPLEELSDGRTTESRLKFQEPFLAEAIQARAGMHGSVECEAVIYDDSAHLWGTVDLLLKGGNGITLIDLKSGADAAKESLPEAITRQLLLYAVLVKADRGCWPTEVGVYSLRCGLRSIMCAESDSLELLSQVLSARDSWAEGHRPPNPAPQHCHLCNYRFNCTEHWQAINGWDDPDAVEGVLESIAYAANGMSSLTLTSERGTVWVSNVPARLASGLRIGSVTRGVRVRRRRRGRLEDRNSQTWYATENSDFNSVSDRLP